jgi:hypothetical protein
MYVSLDIYRNFEKNIPVAKEVTKMKNKVVLMALGVLLFVFCTTILSQAAVSPRYQIQPPVNDHPWQHDGSPDPGDHSNPGLAPGIIWPIIVNGECLLLIRVPNSILEPKCKAAKAVIGLEDKHGSEGR